MSNDPRACEVCGKPRQVNSVVCSDACKAIRLSAFRLCDKYFPTHGCENCWGDLHTGCTEQCKREFREATRFGQDLWRLVHFMMRGDDAPDFTPHPKEAEHE